MDNTNPPRWKKVAAGTPRVLLGVITALFALLHFNHQTPLPDTPIAHQAFEQAFIDAGYFFPALAVIEIVAALMLIVNRWLPLAIVILCPITMNYVLFKVFLDPSTLVVPLIYTLLIAGVAYQKRESLQFLVQSNR
jgi:uncharacterized membrane protein YphA (DoxX/SURF4 family)